MFLMNALPTDRPTDQWTQPIIEMRGRINCHSGYTEVTNTFPLIQTNTRRYQSLSRVIAFQ